MDKVIISKFILLLCTVYVNCATVSISPNLKIINVDRLIDISSQIVKVTNKISFENAGREPVPHFVFTVDPQSVDKLAIIKARVSDLDVPLSVAEVTIDKKKCWLIKFENPIDEGKRAVVDVYYSLIDYLQPYPTQITQRQKQFIKFIGNCYIYSPYPVSKVTTSIALGSKNIESFTRFEPSSYSDSHILYGPYKDLAPYSVNEVVIHYENNSPFLIASKLERKIEISHWGNIAVEEEITLEHTGAKLKGPFSRYDYQREPDSGMSSVKSFKTTLPGTAQDIYYRDEIGNISTSHLYSLENSVEVELRPRFPLFGGWNTQYILGYNIPSFTYLYTKGDNFLLKMPLIDHIFDNMVVKEARIEIILPEGSHNIELSLPYPAERLADTLHHTYLDTIGRPVITIKKTNLVEDHIEPFELRYVFPKMFMLLEPLLIIGFLLILFVTVIIYVRLDFSLSKDEMAEQRLRISGLCGKFVGYQDRVMKLFLSFDDKLNAAKYSPDLNSFNAAVKYFNNEYKTLSTQISEISSKLKNESPENVEKINDIQKLDKQLKELYHQQQTLYIEKLIPRKINKSGFLDAENNFIKKKDELVGKINKLIKSLE
ncbi:dolichyl-diphosphooligosaccharide--protein glycosyltransferase subunit 1 [Planococcus citri]|uniref:dolichyl-diphosphooligosaccharide--protein glycosyltransferase subunit 1 n=1 Tax=Planococcus citri TaxID=170843 RepID=UPI0031F872D9